MDDKLLLQFNNDIKLLYPHNIVYMELYDSEPTLILVTELTRYEIEIKSLHHIESEGDLIIEQCKKIFLQYRRQHTLQQLV